MVIADSNPHTQEDPSDALLRNYLRRNRNLQRWAWISVAIPLVIFLALSALTVQQDRKYSKLLAMVEAQNAIIRTQKAEIARANAEAKDSRGRISELEAEISRQEHPPIPQDHALVASLDLSLPSGNLGTVEPNLERHVVPAQFSVLDLTFDSLPKTAGHVEVSVEGAARSIQGRKLVVTTTGHRTFAKLRLSRQELGPFVGGTKEIVISLSEPGHALLGRIRLVLEEK